MNADELLLHLREERAATNDAIGGIRERYAELPALRAKLRRLSLAIAALTPEAPRTVPKPRASRGLAERAMRHVLGIEPGLTMTEAINLGSAWLRNNGETVPGARSLRRAYESRKVSTVELPAGADEIPIAGAEEVAEANAAAERATDRAVAEV